jgi:hypothetical protein
LKEAHDQATTNQLPSGAEARLPSDAMTSKPAVPLWGFRALTNQRRITRGRLSHELKKSH